MKNILLTSKEIKPTINLDVNLGVASGIRFRFPKTL